MKYMNNRWDQAVILFFVLTLYTSLLNISAG